MLHYEPSLICNTWSTFLSLTQYKHNQWLLYSFNMFSYMVLILVINSSIVIIVEWFRIRVYNYKSIYKTQLLWLKLY